MKRILTTVLATLVAVYGYAQNTYPYPENANLGIGTTNPEARLSVKNTAAYEISTFNSIATGGYLTFKTADVVRGHLQYGMTLNGNGGGTHMLLTNADVGGHIALQTRTSSGFFNSNAFIVNSNGNIGTSSPIPIGPAASTLGINSTSSAYSGGVSYMADGQVKGYTYYDYGAMALQGAAGVPIKFMTNNAEVVRLTKGGNMGIGTTIPEARLAVKNTDAHEIATFNSKATGGYVTFKTADIVRAHLQYGLTLAGGENGNNVLITNVDQGGSVALQTRTASGGLNSQALVVNSTGDVGIGTATTDAKLTVAGRIHSQEVKVSIGAGGGADFVFEKDYKLKPLDDVAEYISVNKHLPEIASAKEMKKNGLELGEMNIKLLQKIEELTLYMIEQNKVIQMQNKRLDIQKGEIDQLKSKL